MKLQGLPLEIMRKNCFHLTKLFINVHVHIGLFSQSLLVNLKKYKLRNDIYKISIKRYKIMKQKVEVPSNYILTNDIPRCPGTSCTQEKLL